MIGLYRLFFEGTPNGCGLGEMVFRLVCNDTSGCYELLFGTVRKDEVATYPGACHLDDFTPTEQAVFREGMRDFFERWLEKQGTPRKVYTVLEIASNSLAVDRRHSSSDYEGVRASSSHQTPHASEPEIERDEDGWEYVCKCDVEIIESSDED